MLKECVETWLLKNKYMLGPIEVMVMKSLFAQWRYILLGYEIPCLHFHTNERDTIGLFYAFCKIQLVALCALLIKWEYTAATEILQLGLWLVTSVVIHWSEERRWSLVLREFFNARTLWPDITKKCDLNYFVVFAWFVAKTLKKVEKNFYYSFNTVYQASGLLQELLLKNMFMSPRETYWLWIANATDIWR